MLRTILYHNPNYKEKDTWLIYFGNGRLYMSTTFHEMFKTIAKPTFEVTDDNIDSYATSRNFEKVLEYYDDPYRIEWFNGYDKPEEKGTITWKLTGIRNKIISLIKYSTNVDNVFDIYQIINSLYNKIT